MSEKNGQQNAQNSSLNFEISSIPYWLHVIRIYLWFLWRSSVCSYMRGFQSYDQFGVGDWIRRKRNKWIEWECGVKKNKACLSKWIYNIFRRNVFFKWKYHIFEYVELCLYARATGGSLVVTRKRRIWLYFFDRVFFLFFHQIQNSIHRE